MPIINGVVTKSVKQVWQSPDGQRTINEVTMDYNGKLFRANTFSDKIAAEGWSGDVESYEKPGRNGSQTFVRSAPQEGNGWSGGSQGGQASQSGTKSGYVPKDEAAIKAMWAIREAVNWIGSTESNPEVIEALAQELFAMVDRVKTGETTTDSEKVWPVTDAELSDDPQVRNAALSSAIDETLNSEPLDLSDINDVLNTPQQETPWGKAKS